MANKSLAIDALDGFTLASSTGKIVGVAATDADLRAAGFTAAKGYQNNRLVHIDDTDSSKWNPNVEPGWYLLNGAVQSAMPLTSLQTVQRDINIFRGVFTEKEDAELPKLLSREKVDTVLDSGHSWVDDILHGWVKPWLRLVEKQLREQKAATNPDPTVYAADLAAFLLQADTPGLLGFHAAALRATWRPLRGGTVAWEYDSATGGTKTGTSRAVTYPDGFTVATWSAYAAMQTL